MNSGAVEAIKFRMERQGLTAKDLEAYIGKNGRVSEMQNGKRTLSLSMIKNFMMDCTFDLKACCRRKWQRFAHSDVERCDQDCHDASRILLLIEHAGTKALLAPDQRILVISESVDEVEHVTRHWAGEWQWQWQWQWQDCHRATAISIYINKKAAPISEYDLSSS
jgi:transcriptional regulator with XRE-family HTH domain